MAKKTFVSMSFKYFLAAFFLVWVVAINISVATRKTPISVHYKKMNQSWTKKTLPNSFSLDTLRVEFPKSQTTLAQYKGSWVLVNFWATWCPPCVREMPSLHKLGSFFRNKSIPILKQMPDLKVLTVAVNTKWKQVTTHFEKSSLKASFASNNLAFGLGWDPSGKTANGVGTTVYPESYLFDHRGFLIAKIVGEQHWTSRDMLMKLIQFMRKK